MFDLGEIFRVRSTLDFVITGDWIFSGGNSLDSWDPRGVECGEDSALLRLMP